MATITSRNAHCSHLAAMRGRAGSSDSNDDNEAERGGGLPAVLRIALCKDDNTLDGRSSLLHVPPVDQGLTDQLGCQENLCLAKVDFTTIQRKAGGRLLARLLFSGLTGVRKPDGVSVQAFKAVLPDNHASPAVLGVPPASNQSLLARIPVRHGRTEELVHAVLVNRRDPAAANAILPNGVDRLIVQRYWLILPFQESGDSSGSALGRRPFHDFGIANGTGLGNDGLENDWRAAMAALWLDAFHQNRPLDDSSDVAGMNSRRREHDCEEEDWKDSHTLHRATDQPAAAPIAKEYRTRSLAVAPAAAR